MWQNARKPPSGGQPNLLLLLCYKDLRGRECFTPYRSPTVRTALLGRLPVSAGLVSLSASDHAAAARTSTGFPSAGGLRRGERGSPSGCFFHPPPPPATA